jgi:hypothetical protein
MARFQTVIRKSRFVVTGYSPQQMIAIAEVLRTSVHDRITSGLDVRDNPAPPLRRNLRSTTKTIKGQKLHYRILNSGSVNELGYAHYKEVRGLNPIRDWVLTGRTMRSLKVLSAAVNRAVIGFTDVVSNRRAAINNQRWRQFGVSPNDKRKVLEALKTEPKPVQARAA